MTKILIITNKSDITSDFIVKKLKERDIDFYRFNTEELSKTCFVTLDFQNDKYVIFDKNTSQMFDLKQFSSVYYRRPELPIIENNSLEAGEITFVKNELYYTLEGIYKILKDTFWISSVFSIREAENKIYQLQIAQTLDFDIPKSLITNNYVDFCNFYNSNNKNCIIKPIKSGLIGNIEDSKVVFTNHLKEITNQEQVEQLPNYLQEHLSKKYDVRVIVVGKKCFATKIHSQDTEETKTDWRNGENILEHTKIMLPKKIKRKCIDLLKILKLQFGAIDFILDKKDNFIFLEINPNGQWAWIEKQTGYEISNEIVNLLAKKRKREKKCCIVFLVKQIREFFWPLLENTGNINSYSTDIDISKIDSKNLNELFNRVLTCYNEEEERRKTVESKSSLFIGTLSVAVSIVIAIYANLAKDNTITIWQIISMGLLFILIIYLIRTVWFSIKALQRKTYFILSAKDYISAYSKQNPHKDLITNLSNAIQQNQETNNRKVDNMTMAQEYFKRAIVTICLFVSLLLLKFTLCSTLQYFVFLPE